MSTAAAGIRPAAKSPYFVNGWVDFSIIGGVSVLGYLLCKQFQPTEASGVLLRLAGALVWIVNWPHFSATLYRLYHSPANIAQYPMTALGVPILVAAGAAASLAQPETVAPAYIKLFLLWSSYHFCGQSLGISLIYAKRSGFPVGRLERLALSGAIFGTFLTSNLLGESYPGPRKYFDVAYPTLGLPPWPAQVAATAMYVCAGAFLVLYVRACLVHRRLFPPILLLPALAQYVWFVPGNSVASFNTFVPFFHSLQYLLIAWSMQLKERLDESGTSPSRGFVWAESVKWGLINILGGAALFWAIPRLGYADRLFDPGVAEPILIAGVQLHHFFVDGVIWKLRNPRVGSPLLVNIDDLVGAPVARESARTAA